MIDYGPFRFAAPPRMATGWFCRAAAIADFEDWPSAEAYGPGPERGSKPVVTTIRHPATWLGSYYYWARGERCGHPYCDRLQALGKKYTFLRFLEAVIEEMPGFVWGLHQQYNANIVLRVEDLPWAAVEFFQSLGTHPDRLNAIAALPAQNPRYGHPVPTVPRNLLSRLMNAEHELAARYEYLGK